MANFYVYALITESSGLIYVGMARDPDKRLIEHNKGKSKFTKGHMPWKLIFCYFASPPIITWIKFFRKEFHSFFFQGRKPLI